LGKNAKLKKADLTIENSVVTPVVAIKESEIKNHYRQNRCTCKPEPEELTQEASEVL